MDGTPALAQTGLVLPQASQARDQVHQVHMMDGLVMDTGVTHHLASQERAAEDSSDNKTVAGALWTTDSAIRNMTRGP